MKYHFLNVKNYLVKKVIDISGKYGHVFAVCDDGSVYARGSNYYGEIGVGEQVKNVFDFIEIESLKKYKIVAGSYHSLFQTADGMVANMVKSCSMKFVKKVIICLLKLQLLKVPLFVLLDIQNRPLSVETKCLYTHQAKK